MLTSSAVSGAYWDLWQKFTNAVDAAGHSCVGAPQVKQLDGSAELLVSAFVYLKGWKWKANSNKREQTIEILLRINERLDTESGCVAECSTQLGYYIREDDGDLRPLMEIHYDFERTTSSAHPVFHAQLGRTTWDEKDKQDVDFTGQIQKRDWYKNARIPTAYMGFTGALLALTADHLKAEHYNLFLNAVRRSSCAKDWGPSCPRLSSGLTASGATPQAFHWYDESVAKTPGATGRAACTTLPPEKPGRSTPSRRRR